MLAFFLTLGLWNLSLFLFRLRKTLFLPLSEFYCWISTGWLAGQGVAHSPVRLSISARVGAHQRLSASLSLLTWIYQTPLVSAQQHRPILPFVAVALDGSLGGGVCARGYFWTHHRTHCECVLLITPCIRGLLLFYAPFHAYSCNCEQRRNQAMLWTYFVCTSIKRWVYGCRYCAANHRILNSGSVCHARVKWPIKSLMGCAVQ